MSGTDGALCSERGCSIAIYPPTDERWEAIIEHRSAPVWHLKIDPAFCDDLGMIEPKLMAYLDVRARAIHERGEVIHTPGVPCLPGVAVPLADRDGEG